MNAKEAAGRAAAAHVHSGMVVGLGTGSTAYFAIQALGERVAAGLAIKSLPTSEASASQARDLGIELVTLEQCPVIDLTIDGADEIDPNLDLIKGLGGALLREKIVAEASTRQIIIADDSKVVDKLGNQAPLPVEVIPFAWPLVQTRLSEWGLQVERRLDADGQPFTTDEGNCILDARFPHGIDDPAATDQQLNSIPGVVENGLFVGRTDLVLIGRDDGTCRQLDRS
ncbi:MAG: ribose-5-phosphate isomerase RpiA [Candidatus Latescibacteria bacterium]|nr:ribose-5-phosphate isomerase RpiA [Candidatus Latescibacterota bacterium]